MLFQFLIFFLCFDTYVVLMESMQIKENLVLQSLDLTRINQ